uniref:Reverse transcriptase domain-containing protein n=1 Tax=Beta vulgaris subsp. vulgaris TaxID=3555 RepID=F4NCK9_BETVV|nr:hypothetical protein [Beta vulgaris subsp. vulgaris]
MKPILSWNIRGLNARMKRASLRKLIAINNPGCVFVQETKMENINARLMRTCWKSNEIEWIFSPSRGSSGGILAIWDKNIFNANSNVIHQSWIAISGIFSTDQFECTLITVYNPCEIAARSEVWKQIIEFQNSNPLPCLLVGDFNEVLRPSERGSLSFSHNGINDFKSFVQELKLLEIPSSSRAYTWYRANSKSLLDRLLVSPEWVSHCPNIKVSILQRGLSDHCPLLVHSHIQEWGPKPFRFNNCWLTDPKCMKIVEASWSSSPKISVVEKLKETKKRLKEWNLNEFGSIDANIRKLEDCIANFDKEADERELDKEELEKRREAQADLWKWMKRKEIYWAQRSRITWLKAGDKNTKFFHAIASNKKRKNMMACIETDGQSTNDPSQIKKEARAFFKKIFKEDHVKRPTLENLHLKRLSQNQANSLITPFTTEEIDTAVSSCASDKAPGPDGFNFKFVKSAWDIIKTDIYGIVNDFWETGCLPQGCNTAYIALIPKIDNPSSLKDYRPISMVGFIYKIVAKLLAKRLQSVISSLISPLQSSYVKGRQILDGALVASEIIESCKKRNIEAILLKLDFHKAYDSVSWNFLQWTLDQMNFPVKWCEWIKTCVTSASASILVNGSPTPPFKLHRGLRQGDPLSPFLFVLVGEVLSQMISKATSLQLWRGIPACSRGSEITHLQYADDTLMFCEANTNSLKNIQKTLIIFQLVSGLQVNFHKSSLMGLNVTSSWIQEAANSLMCKIGTIPFSYLGLPIGDNPARIRTWDPIIDKLEKKLASWKGKLLSLGGRLTLIKASLSNLPLYYMSLFPVPKGVIEKINKLMRAFLWCGDFGKRPFSMVSWSIVQQPKTSGGLGIGNILHKNLSLLFKWIWRLFENPSSMWGSIIRSKYNYSSTCSISDLKKPVSGGPWKSICAAVLGHEGARLIAVNGMRKNVGNGISSLFWHDTWLCEQPLKRIAPRLFSIAINKNSSIASYGVWEGFNWVWVFSWKRVLRPQDLVEKAHLDELLKSVRLDPNADDQLIWAPEKSGRFSTKSFSKELSKMTPPTHSDAVKGVWRGLVPHRIEVFVWIALLGKINSRHKLAAFGIISEEEDICPLCDEGSETSDHLLLHCVEAQKLWAWWLDIWKVKWVFPSSLLDAFSQWKCIKKKSNFFKKVWAASFFVIIWTIWKERNLRIFHNSSSNAMNLQDLVLLRLGWWIGAWDCRFPYSPTDIQRNPLCLEWSDQRVCAQLLKQQPENDSWVPPPPQVLKWNVDASVINSNSCSAIGGILRNHKGEFMCVFSSPVPYIEINCAEILAIHRAIQISLQSDKTKNANLLLESDSANAVMWCNSESGGPWNMNFQLNFIRSMRKKGLNISITYKGRSSNVVADSLAKQGHHRKSEFIAWL